MKNLKLLFVLFLGVGLTFASCKKDDGGKDDGGGDNPTPTEKTCYVVKETSSDNSYHEMIYNTDHLITDYNTYKIDGSLGESNKLTYTNGKISKLESYEGTVLKAEFEIKYASSHIDSVILYMDTLGTMKRVGFYKYTYNSDKISSISMYIEFMGQMIEISKDEYIFSGDNVSTKTSYEMGGSFTLVLSSTTTFEYDDKVNPYRNVGINDLMGEPAFMSKNNITKLTTKDDAGNVIDAESYNFTYEYNSDNYYTKYVKTNFDNSKSTTYTLEYDCQ